MSEQSPQDRRSFLSQIGTGAAGFTAGAATVITIPVATAQSVGGARFQPTRHEQDDWYDKIPGQHRLVFDTTEPSGMGSALTFATNYYLANQTGYGLKDADLAVVIIARHFSTPYGYNDAMWTKYGEQFSSFTKDPAKTNTYARQINGLVARGVNLAICQLATRALAGTIARATGGTTDDIFAELSANLQTNGHLVPAGIVAVGRAQERGYALVNAG
jgi:intracellular sulfur oxidation DsrE/DsrF family protein